jgi:dTDP-4-dehydrorhamnose reductase
LGINHYLTSERYLDHAWWHYPPEFRAGNGREEYADVEAVRLLHLEDEVGPAKRLRETWERYGRTIAITETHHASTPEEQVRWLLDVWAVATTLESEGIDLRAVTAWSLFGAVDWNSLVTRSTGFYEPGAFDTRHSPPSPTLLAGAIEGLCRYGAYDSQIESGPPWWRRPDRVYTPRPLERRAV